MPPFYLSEGMCRDGIVYKEDTCIFAIVQNQFDYSTSQSICESMGGHLAYIDSEEKYFIVTSYLRTKLVDYYGSIEDIEYWKKDFWWGATYKVVYINFLYSYWLSFTS